MAANVDRHVMGELLAGVSKADRSLYRDGGLSQRDLRRPERKKKEERLCEQLMK